MDDDLFDDPEKLFCKKHERWEPCRSCLRDEGFYDPCADCGEWRGHHHPNPLKANVCGTFRKVIGNDEC